LVAACATAVCLGTTLPAPLPARWAAAVTGALLALAALVDLREHKLPNRLLGGALAVSGLGSSVVALGAGQLEWVVRAFLGLLLAGGLMLLVRCTRGVGMGDVKMAGVVGASCGGVSLVAAPLAIATAALLAAGYGLLARRTHLPLGPALWAGWATVMVAMAAGWLS